MKKKSTSARKPAARPAPKSPRPAAKPAPAKSRRKPAAKLTLTPAAGPAARSTPRSAPRSAEDSAARPFIVALGASAGGLEALTSFFASLSPKTGIAFVVVMHRAPDHSSVLPELLGRHTVMPVVTAVDNCKVKPNHVYVAPPGEDLAILHGVLYNMGTSTPEAGELRLTIDYFLRSLAQDQRERAICIILSGTGSDGTMGLRAIKGESGLAMVQDPQSARFGGMPKSAVDTGLADFVLQVEQMPQKLGAYVEGPPRKPELPAASATDERGLLSKIFVLMRSRTGHDFSSYKTSTLLRRIERRMQVHQLLDLGEYVRFLQQNQHELDILFKELLIGVTSFFRDRDCWSALAEVALAPLLLSKPTDSIIRAWVPGCSTGEEAYSIAIILSECMERLQRRHQVQIYATDLDSHSIAVARSGVYPEGIGIDIGPARLSRFFTPVTHGYRISKEIREMVIFAPQNLISDPPFTKLDLLSCRNLLIYLIATMQWKLISKFHYALKPGGVLLLGASETIGALSPCFEALDKQWKLYRKKDQPQSPRTELTKWLPATAEQPSVGATSAGNKLSRPPSIFELTTRLLLDTFAPPSVLTNDKGDISFIHGRLGQYLEPPPGQPTQNILEMARGGLQIDLGMALKRAAHQNQPVVHKGVRFRGVSGEMFVDLTVRRVLDPEALRGLLLITFQPVAVPAEPPPARRRTRRSAASAAELTRIEELERELRYSKETLQATIDEAQTANEELRTTNEEMQATNEEMQSTNEELETSKEEVQSLNEELQTVNAELQNKVEDLSQIHDDMTNLLDSTSIATVFLTPQLRIKRFTSQSRKIIHLIPSDIGRPLSDIATRLVDTNIVKEAASVLRSQQAYEAEVQTVDAEYYLMRLIPYLTADSRIEGVVLTFVDITRWKRLLTR